MWLEKDVHLSISKPALVPLGTWGCWSLSQHVQGRGPCRDRPHTFTPREKWIISQPVSNMKRVSEEHSHVQGEHVWRTPTGIWTRVSHCEGRVRTTAPVRKERCMTPEYVFCLVKVGWMDFLRVRRKMSEDSCSLKSGWTWLKRASVSLTSDRNEPMI